MPIDQQPAQPGHLVTVASGPAEPDVGAPAGHLGGDRDRCQGARLGHDRGLMRVVLGVQHHAGQPGLAHLLREALGFGHVERADQDRPPGGVRLSHLADDGVLLVRGGPVEPVRLVLADAGQVRRDDRDLQPVELAQLLAHRHRGAGHPAGQREAPDQGLDRDAVQDLAALAGQQSLLGLDRRVQAVRPALPPGHPAPRGTDQLDPVVPDDVIHVPLEQGPGVQRHVELGERVQVLLGVEVDPAQGLLRDAGTGVGQEHVAALVVHFVVQSRQQAPGDLGHLAARNRPPRPSRPAPAAPAPRPPAPSRPRR